jgi:hypothetical protein
VGRAPDRVAGADGVHRVVGLLQDLDGAGIDIGDVADIDLEAVDASS